MMTSLAPGQLTPPLMEDLQYTAYISPDTPLLTTLTYMDGRKNMLTLYSVLCTDSKSLCGCNAKSMQDASILLVILCCKACSNLIPSLVQNPGPLLLQPVISSSLTQLPVSHA